MTEFRTKRIYDESSADDGIRLLVDRLWPRGVSKEAAQIDHWAKELTPSHELRKWLHAHSDQYAEFANRYWLELNQRIDQINQTLSLFDTSTVTLVTSTKLERGHVPVLKEFLEKLEISDQKE